MNIDTTKTTQADLSQIRQRFGTFRSGKSNLTKDDLQSIASESGSNGPADKILANFDAIDTNGDGVSIGELQTYAKANGWSHPGKGKGEGDPHEFTKDELLAMKEKAGSTDSSAVAGLSLLLQNFDTADTDKNGKVSRSEFEGFAKLNGISMPHHGHHHKDQTQSPISDTGETTDVTSQTSTGVNPLVHSMVKMFCQRYASGSAPAAAAASSVLSGIEA